MYATTTYRTASDINSGMLRVYNHMALAVLTSMLTAALVASSVTMMFVLFSTWFKWVVIFAPLAFVFFVPVLLNSGMNRTGKIFVLHLFAGLIGLSMSAVFAVYTSTSIVTAFMGAAVLFGTMSFWGYFTKRSLESWGQFLFVGLIAIIIASVVNIFLGNTVLQMVISAIAVIIFTALTAYDTQRIREQLMTDSSDSAELSGALSLYLNFINIFTSLLQLFGQKSE